nr:FMN-binding split barrel [Tanacetum cinerariifolium]
EKATRLPPVEEFKTVFVYTIRGMLSTFSQTCSAKKDHGATSLRE